MSKSVTPGAVIPEAPNWATEYRPATWPDGPDDITSWYRHGVDVETVDGQTVDGQMRAVLAQHWYPEGGLKGPEIFFSRSGESFTIPNARRFAEDILALCDLAEG